MSGVDGPGGDLVGQAQIFAADLTEMLEGSVTYSASLRIEEISPSLEENELPKGVIVEPTRSKECIPLATAADAEVGLFLRLSFTLQLDEQREHLAVQTSTFGLCIDERTGSCPIRVEYDRAMRYKRPAHVHVDGHAEGIAHAYGRMGRKPKTLGKLHVPLGHRRYRPSVEDFLLFLAEERLLPDRQPGWQETVERHQRAYERRQLKAAVRRNPQAAAEQLEREGWTVAPPP